MVVARESCIWLEGICLFVSFAPFNSKSLTPHNILFMRLHFMLLHFVIIGVLSLIGIFHLFVTDDHTHDHVHDPGVSSVSIVCEGNLDLEKVCFSCSFNFLICQLLNYACAVLVENLFDIVFALVNFITLRSL